MDHVEVEETISLTDGCRLIDTGLRRLKKLANKKSFQIIEVQGYRNKRILTDEFLSYVETLLVQKEMEAQCLKDSVLELKLHLGMSVTEVDELKNDKRQFNEFVTYLNYLTNVKTNNKNRSIL